MKRFLSLLLAALMALAGLGALAAPAYYDAEGFALDYDAIAAKSENTPALVDYGVLDHDPYISEILVAYYALPRDAVTDLQRRMESAENEEAYQRFYDVLSRFFGWIGAIIVTDAKTLSEIGIEEPIPEDCALIEFGTAGDYHFYWLTEPVDELLAAFDTDEDMSEYGGTPQELKERAIADIERVLDDVIFLDRGRLTLTGSADQVREQKGMSIDGLFREVFRC